jgi:pimeloyl-ACP methyl ester carboxylesterase
MELEGFRLAAEYAALLGHPVFSGRGVPRAAGRPVLLVPGFLASDWTLGTLFLWLRRRGYRPEFAGIAWNVQPSEVLMARLGRRLRLLADRHGGRVSIVGHSRGGLLAKVLADRHHGLVDQVIALGAPLADTFDVHPVTLAAARVVYLANRVGAGTPLDAEDGFLRELAAPCRVPVVSIYSRDDGVVHWRACIRPDVTAAEVRGSHVGMAVNAAVYELLGTLLARPLAAATDGELEVRGPRRTAPPRGRRRGAAGGAGPRRAAVCSSAIPDSMPCVSTSRSGTES